VSGNGHLLSVKNVSKHFGGLVALSNVSFDVEEGEVLGLMGPNGAGKTTLLNVIAGDYEPDHGEIVFNGRNITKLPPHKICHLGIGRTFQIPLPFNGLTVTENALVGGIFGGRRSREEANREGQQILQSVGLLDKKDVMAARLPTLALKKLEIVRARSCQPKLLLLDEVFAGTTEAEVPQVLENVALIRKAGITVIIIEHVMKILCNVVDRIVVLDKGSPIAAGKPEEIMRHPKVMEAYFGV
jgi:branched-chain amino acid transport system ATP-binding protein